MHLMPLTHDLTTTMCLCVCVCVSGGGADSGGPESVTVDESKEMEATGSEADQLSDETDGKVMDLLNV